jgi:uncharacterized membrane protein YfcA
VSPPHAVVAALIFAAGACVQAAVGFGANLVAAPLLVLLSDRFVPGPVVVASGVLNLLVTRRNGRGMVDPTVGTANAGQVVGALAAGGVMVMLPRGGLSILFAVLVLTAVVLTAVGIRLRPTRRSIAGAGAAAGFMGTVSGIGGPPIALAYIGLTGPALRATLARFFLVGNLVSIPTLIVVGQLWTDEIVPCLVLVPGAILGFMVSPALARHLDQRTVRPVVLVLSTAAAIAVIVRTIV